MSLSIGSSEPTSRVPSDYNLLLAVINGNEAQAAKLRELKDAQAASEAALAELNLGKAAAQALADAEVEREEAHALLASIQENQASLIQAAETAAGERALAADQHVAGAEEEATKIVEEARLEAKRVLDEARTLRVAADQEKQTAYAAGQEAKRALDAANEAMSEAVTAKAHQEDLAAKLQHKLDILNTAIIQATEPPDPPALIAEGLVPR